MLDTLAREGLVERTPSRGTFTVPEAIARRKRLLQSRPIYVLSIDEQLERGQPHFYSQIYQGILDRAGQAGYRVIAQARPGHCAGEIFTFEGRPRSNLWALSSWDA